ncbi:RNA polymerase sigma factor [Spirosoma gilvum]
MKEGINSFWEATYRQSIAKMIGLCYRYTYDRQIAEDLAHDAFLIAIDKSASFENKGPFDAWLRRIVVNVALQYLREQKKQKAHQVGIAYEISSVEVPEEANYPERSFSETELLEAICLLPQHHRLVFNLYVFDGYTHAQIGAQLGISEGTSKSHLARARKKLRETLTEKVGHHKMRKWLLLLWLPDQFGWIDQVFRSHLNEFGLQPQQVLISDSMNALNIPMSSVKSAFSFHEIFMKTDIAGLAIVLNVTLVSWFHFTAYPIRQRPAIVEKSAELPRAALQPAANTNKKLTVVAPLTATLSKNTIIASKPMKTSETMKKVNTVGALLLTSTALAFDSTSQLRSAQLPIGLINQPIVENTARETVGLFDRIRPAAKLDSPKMQGTFYASELFWAEGNNQLYFKGNHVNVSLNTQKFTGSGKFSFLEQLSYLVVNGTVMKPNEIIPLSDKKYNLVKLPPAEAVKKYGDRARLGAVEITLAE